MERLWIRLICLLFFGHLFQVSICQKYNYVSYSTRDGLAGNMVYDMCQDHLGFIWFGTDNGLSRFDGKNFKNYTVRDGLPDNEVLVLYEDTKKRLWLGAFKNELCFYQNGRFYRSEIDSIFSGVSLESRPSFFYEDSEGSLWIFCEKQIFFWPENEKIQEVPFYPSIKDRIRTLSIRSFYDGKTCNTYISFNDSLFRFKKDGTLIPIAYNKVISNERSIKSVAENQKSKIVDFRNDIIRFTLLGDNPHMVATVDGAYELDPLSWKKIDSFLIGKGVTKAIIDKEGIYWFATLGDGVHKLVSKNSKVLTVEEGVDAVNEAFCIWANGDSILTGHGGSRMVLWQKNRPPENFIFNKYLKQVENSIATNRLKSIKRISNNHWLLGFDGFLLKWNSKIIDFLPIDAVKTIESINNEFILVASGKGVYKIQLNKFQNLELIWDLRATCAIMVDDIYYIGTVNGLYTKDTIGKIRYYGDIHPSLKRRIAGIKKMDNDIWVATSDSGLVCLRDGRFYHAISESNGLSSNICRSIEIKGSDLWVGTNNGLNKISVRDQKADIRIYNSFNVLPGDAISSIFVNDNNIYIGTPEGLTFFEEASLENKLFCNLLIDGARVGTHFFSSADTAIVGYDNNRIEIFLSGISTLAAGSIVFYYKLKDFDNEWRETIDPAIVYSNLPPGNYTLEVQAKNIFGAESNIQTMQVHVDAPFWYSYKFWLFTVLIFGGVAVFVFYKLTKRKQHKLEQQLAIERQIAVLEQKALQSQMNPHFIFNSLNSIQQFILTNNVKEANKYLAIFGGLIRETMEFSAQGSISLEKEMHYIDKYLQLEQMRFGNKFQFKVEAYNIENIARLDIPVMLIQPFVENAVRHGIRYRNDDKGFILVSFKMDAGYLLCSIRDNGMGMKATKALKSKQHIEYQSRGMDLTEKRIAMLNKVYGEKVTMKVMDIAEENEKSGGTEVVLKIKIDEYAESDSDSDSG